MNKFIIILGMLVFSGTDALAANLKSMDGARHEIETCSLSSCNTTQVGSINCGRGNNRLTPEGRSNPAILRGNIHSIVAEVAPSPDRGTPDSRGKS